jgi:hypothetical protein
MGALIGHGTLLERIQTFLKKCVSVIVKQSVINHGLMRNVQNQLSKQWLQKQSAVNEDNLSNVRQKASRPGVGNLFMLEGRINLAVIK